MTGNVSRRGLIGSVGTVGALAAVGAGRADTADLAARQVAANSVNVVDAGADPEGRRDCSAAFQAAIDRIAPTGGIIVVPAGRYAFDRGLSWVNDRNRRAPGIRIAGAGAHATTLVHRFADGPLLRVRGVPTRKPIDTSYVWGGGINDLTIVGEGNGAGQHGLEILGWYYGEIQNCHFSELGGDAIRAAVDTSAEPNPDFTSSTMFVRGCWLERLGGAGFRDTSDFQGAPAWSWDRCVFFFCQQGGAIVRSGAHSFTKCSFALAGSRNERGPRARRAYGLYFDSAVTAASQHLVEGCEFDNNLTAHIGARFLAASSILNNRFIAGDHAGLGRLTPAVGIEIGSGDVHASVLGVQIRQSFFRFDMKGSAVGIDFANYANVRDIEIAGSVFTEPPGSSITRVRGHDPGGRGATYGYVVRDSAYRSTGA